MPEKPEIIIGTTWKHRRQGYLAVVNGLPLIKDDDAANWRNGVSYTTNGLDERQHVRSEVSFLLKFEEYSSES